MLKNKVALVTGASSGIGRAVALAWAREGARVVASDTDREGGEQTVALVRAQGGDAIFVAADVGKPADAQSTVARAVAHYGRLDVACNNAGIGGPSALTADYPLDGWAQVIDINLSGVFYGMQQQIAAMLKTGGGSIVNMASILGAVGFATAAAYTAAKHGVLGLTQVAALEYGGKGIRVNAASAGNILGWTGVLPTDAVKVKVEDGWLTLSGEVEWQYQRQEAIDCVRHLSGITGITNRIAIRPGPSATVVKSDIEAALKRRAAADATTIAVDVHGCDVTLTGTVHSWAERDLATRSAWGSPGVRNVVDKLHLIERFGSAA